MLYKRATSGVCLEISVHKKINIEMLNSSITAGNKDLQSHYKVTVDDS